MKEIQQFLTRHFITAPISIGSWLFFVMGLGLHIVVATGLLVAIYLGGTFTLKQIQHSSNLKKLGMSRSEYGHIKDQIMGAKVKVRKLNSLYGQVSSVQAFKKLH